jgi:hypothetical protein
VEGIAMQERIITIYCLCDEFVKASGVVEHPCTTMSTAEVMTTALVAADVFGGCFERSRPSRQLVSSEYVSSITEDVWFSPCVRSSVKSALRQ